MNQSSNPHFNCLTFREENRNAVETVARNMVKADTPIMTCLLASTPSLGLTPGGIPGGACLATK